MSDLRAKRAAATRALADVRAGGGSTQGDQQATKSVGLAGVAASSSPESSRGRAASPSLSSPTVPKDVINSISATSNPSQTSSSNNVHHERSDSVISSGASGHRPKNPPTYILEDRLDSFVIDFEKERGLSLTGKEAKDSASLFNLPAHDVSFVRRCTIITDPSTPRDRSDSIYDSSTARLSSNVRSRLCQTEYLLPSPANLSMSSHDATFLQSQDSSIRNSVPSYVDSTFSIYQNNWFGIERPYRNLGVPGPLPIDASDDPNTARDSSSSNFDSNNNASKNNSSSNIYDASNLTSHLTSLSIPPTNTFVVPRNPLSPLNYETGPNADSAISDSVLLGHDDDNGLNDNDEMAESSDDASMIEIGSDSSKSTSTINTPKSLEDSSDGSGSKRKPVRARSPSEVVHMNIAALNAAAESQTDPIDPKLLQPSEDGKNVTGVQRDLLMGQLYPLPDAPVAIDAVPAELTPSLVKFRIVPKDLSFALGNVEPYFGILALYDLSTGERISENFYFDLNNPTTNSLLPVWHEATSVNVDGLPGHVRQGVDAFFTVPQPSPDIWMILRVEKVLQGDSYENVIEPYLKHDAMKEKDKEKLGQTIASFCSRLGAFRQPFCWGMTPVFSDDKHLLHGLNASMKQLHRYKQDISDQTFLDVSQEYTKTGSSKRLKYIAGAFTFDCIQVQETNPAAAVAPRPYLDWTGRLATDPDLAKSYVPEAPESEVAKPDEGSNSDQEDGDDDSKKKDKKKDKKDKKRQPERRMSVSSADKVAKLLGASSTSVLNISTPRLASPRSGGSSLRPGGFVPDYYPTHHYTQQVGSFPAPAVPFTDFHNIMFIYPQELIMNKSSSQIIARNLVVQIQLLANEDDEPHQALEAIFNRESTNPLAKQQMSVVNYHDKTPKFYDEFKLALPHRVTSQHTIRFSFYHVQCQKKDTSTATMPASSSTAPNSTSPAALATVMTLVGYSNYPILKDGFIPEEEVTLPIMTVGDGYQSLGSAGLGSTGSMIMDPKKASFRFKVKLASSVYTSDKYLNPFFLEYGKGRISTKSGKSETDSKDSSHRVRSLVTALSGLLKTKPRKLLQFLPTILHQLFHIMCTQPTPIANKCFHVLVHLLHQIYSKESQMQIQSISGVLNHYLDYLFFSPPNLAPLADVGVTWKDTEAPPSIANTLHFHLARAWTETVREHAASEHEKLHRFSWFFFKLIYLSMAAKVLDLSTSSLNNVPTSLTLSQMATASLISSTSVLPKDSSSKEAHNTSTPGESSDAWNTDRVSRFSKELHITLKKLVLLLSWEVQERHNASLNQSKELSKRIAGFLVDLFSVCDRGFVIDLAMKALKEVAPDQDETASELRSDFWRVLASYEHWPQLTLPLSVHIDSKNIGQIEEILAKKHFMVGALLKDICGPMGDKASRLRALHILQTLFTKADLDPRLNPSIMTALKRSSDPTNSKNDTQDKGASNLDLVGASDDDMDDEKRSKKEKRQSSKKTSTSTKTRRFTLQQMQSSDPTACATKARYLQAYFPFILRGIDHLDALKKADFDEQRVFLSCWIYLVKNIEPRLLRQWWKSDTLTRLIGFLQVLTLTTQVFEYQGYFSLVQKLNVTSEVTRSVATKAMIEEYYSDGGLGTTGGGAMSLRQKRLEAAKQKAAASPTPALGAASGLGSSSAAIGATSNLQALWSGGSISASSGAGILKEILPADAEGSSTARSRRRQGTIISPQLPKIRWKHPGLDSERGRYESNTVRESHISKEVALIVLDCIETFFITKESDLNALTQPNQLMDQTVSLILSLLSRRQPVDLQVLILRVLTTFAHIFPKPLFTLATPYCSQIAPRILHLCNYENNQVRYGASAFFFLLMKLNLENSPAKNRNFTRVKVQAIISLSKLVAGQNGIRDPSFLNFALNGVQAYAKQYKSPDSSTSEDAFLVQQVSRLALRLRAILEDSVKINQHSGDPEMLADLYHRIASSYRTAPDLRVTWLESLADLHARNDAWAEAAQCLVHIAALISEYLQILEPTEGSMKGAAAFEVACVSAVEEQSMLDAKNMLDEDGVGETHIFTESGLINVVEKSIAYMNKAQLYESANELYKLLIPVHEKNHDYAKLASAYADLSHIFNKIMEAMSNQNRLFGSYYRVAFFGSRFGELNKKEFVYKEPKITRLGEIQERLLTLYSRKLSLNNIQVLTTSGDVDSSKLDPNLCYIQITHISPYFDAWELKQRKTDYERSTNIGRFIFETPFSKGSNKAQSPHLADQWKRKTILTVDSSFPYMKRRMLVTSKETLELSPIETSIELIEGRIRALKTQLEHPNAKTLQHVLQGSVRLQVNAGPQEICKTFLTNPKPFGSDADRLRIVLLSFLDVCQEALAKNKEIINSAQLNFHQELEDGFQAIKEIVEPML